MATSGDSCQRSEDREERIFAGDTVELGREWPGRAVFRDVQVVRGSLAEQIVAVG